MGGYVKFFPSIFISMFLAATFEKSRFIEALADVPESIAKGILYIFIAAVLLLLLIGLNRWKAIKPRRRKK